MKHGYRFLMGALVAVALAAALALIASGGQDSLAAGTIYVDVDATGANNGSSWEHAFTNLQHALDMAVAGDQIWVAEGIYKPVVEHGGVGDRYKSFQMKNGVALYGGFDPSVGVIAFEDRDWVSYVTILSGDLGTAGDASDNCYHVFYHPAGTALNSRAVLDGFTITGGNASELSWPDFAGGGMFNDGSSPSLTNCTFLGNSATDYGGGMYNYESSSPLLTNCTFQNNSATGGFGGGMFNESGSSPVLASCTFQDNSAVYGGGMYNSSYLPATPTEPTLTRCTFSGNSATGGGAMYNGSGSSPTLTACTFTDNPALSYGGGMYNDGVSPLLTNCTFSGNSAEYGGGMFNRNGASPTLTNCTFSGNPADYYGGGMYNQGASPALTNCTFASNSAVTDGGGMLNSSSSSPALTNCILWADTPDEISNYDLASSPAVTYSDVQGGYGGAGNISADPHFADPGNGDFHLGVCSPAIDTGNNLAPDLPDFDFEGDGRILDGDGDGTAIVDMGVDEVAVAGTCSRRYLPLVLKAY
jgi:parallel beta-helix repeat protein